ncbi:MAG TPA: hypothetical protein VGS06_40970 [Streptosporangiaceae bacterium]|nr:hypothetical protein [Streptosporangiaceae bacterium]
MGEPALRNRAVLLLIAIVCVPPIAVILLSQPKTAHLDDVAWIYAHSFAIGIPEEIAIAIPVLVVAWLCRTIPDVWRFVIGLAITGTSRRCALAFGGQ